MHTVIYGYRRAAVGRRAGLRLLIQLPFALALGGVLPATAQTAHVGLPLRNLLVEVRQGEEEEGSQRRQGASGAVVISSGPSSSNVSGGVSVHNGQVYSTRRGDGVQQVLVLNGGRAAVRLGHTQALQWYQVAWNEREGATLLPSTLWLEAGRGIVVQPRWTAGSSTATVEISAESSRLQAQGNPAEGVLREGASASTTLQVPLGEWVTVASTAEHSQQRDQRVWSSREASREGRRIVQIRVTLP